MTKKEKEIAEQFEKLMAEERIIEIIKEKVNGATPKELEEALEIINSKLKEIKDE